MLNTTTWVASPLEQFEVVPFIGLSLWGQTAAPILGLNLTLTNLGFYSLLTVVLVLGLHVLASNDRRLIPSRWSVSLESAYASVHTMVKEQIGSANEIYLPFIYSLFFFLIIANLNGNIPYGFTLGTSAVVSLGLSFSIWFGVTLLGLQKHGLHFFSYFVPAGTPLALVPVLVLIELISYIARAFSLGIRLFSNLVAGHTLLKILSGFMYPMIFSSGLIFTVLSVIPMTLFVALVGLEVMVSVLQAYVFTILTCIYIKDSIDLH